MDPAEVRAQVPSRLRRWQLLIRTAQLTTHRHGRVLELHDCPTDRILAELVALLAAEARDCPFLTWTLDEDRARVGRPLVARIQASARYPHDIDPIALLVENLRRHHDHHPPLVSARPDTDGGTT